MTIAHSLSGRRAMLAAVLFMAPLCAQAPSGEYATLEISPFGGWRKFYSIGSPNTSLTVPLPGGANAALQEDAQRFGSSGILGVRFTQNFHRYIALEEGLTWGPSSIRFLPLAAASGSGGKLSNNTWQLAVNPVLHFTPRTSAIRPFVTAGFAAQWFHPKDDNLLGGTRVSSELLPQFIYGGGIKANLSPRIGIRFDARGSWGSMPRFGLPTAPTASGGYYSPAGPTLGGFELTAGITFGMRRRSDEPPPAPPAPPAPAPAPPEFTLDAINGARDICPGETLQLTVSATNAPGDLAYEWTLNGQAAGTGATLTVPATARGEQEVSVKATSGGTTRTAGPVRFRVKQYSEPAVTISASPLTIARGETSTITANAQGSECGGATRISLSASEGAINGNTFESANVGFDPNAARAQSKAVTITARATDEKGGTGMATTEVTVTERPRARRLDDLVFARNSARVNNCAKRLLIEELSALLRENPNSQVILIGHRDERERAGLRLDRRRALNAAAVLSAGRGICPQLELSRMKLDFVGADQTSPARPAFCGASANVKERRGQAVAESDTRATNRRVEVWFVPDGAEMPDAAKTAKDVPAREVRRLGCPK